MENMACQWQPAAAVGGRGCWLKQSADKVVAVEVEGVVAEAVVAVEV